MKLTHARMVATFVQNATVYDTGHPSTMTSLAQSLDFAWTSVYTEGKDAERALAWLKANVIGITMVTSVAKNSPMWRETAANVPHNRSEAMAYWHEDYDDEPYDAVARAQAEAAFPSLTGGEQPNEYLPCGCPDTGCGHVAGCGEESVTTSAGAHLRGGC